MTSPDAPPATTAVMVVELTTLNELAATPPKLTAVIPLKLVPEIVIVVPGPAAVGKKEEIRGSPTRFLKIRALNRLPQMAISDLPSLSISVTIIRSYPIAE